MQKKLIALAVAGAFVAPAAFADSGNVTIYGVMSASMDFVDNGNNNGESTTQVNDNSSRIGFKGTEDLGNGLAAVWQIESTINSDGAAPGAGFQATSAGTLNGRNTFVGLSSKSMGTVILGRHDTPYKLATRNLDVFADTIADNRSLMGQSGAGTSFDGRQSNVLAYISPTWNGFHFVGAYVAGAENVQNSGQKDGDAWSVAGMYSNGPWFGSLAYERHNVGSGGTGTLGLGTVGAGTYFGSVNVTTTAPLNLADRQEEAWKLGVGYKANNFRIGLAFESTEDDFNNGSDLFGHNSWYLGGGYTFGNNEVKLAYTDVRELGNFSNTGARQWAIGLDHNFSKRTKVFALYTKLTNDNNSAFSLTGGSNGGPRGSVADSDPSAFSIGMRHDF